MSPPTARASASRNLSTASVAAAPALQPTWWIANRSWDTTFFLGSLATGVLLTVIALAAPSLAIPATIVAGILLANTHNLVTGFFFLDPENLAYYRKFPHYYFTVPLALLGAAMGITVAAPVLAFILHVFFTNWHVIRQSVGIQKLYLGRAKTSDTDRNLDATLIYAGGVILNAFALWKFGVLSGTSPLATVETHAAVAFPTGGAVALLGAVLAARVLWLGWRAGRALPGREEPGAAGGLPDARVLDARRLLRPRVDALLPRRASLPFPLPGGAGGDPALPEGPEAALARPPGGDEERTGHLGEDGCALEPAAQPLDRSDQASRRERVEEVEGPHAHVDQPESSERGAEPPAHEGRLPRRVVEPPPDPRHGPLEEDLRVQQVWLREAEAAAWPEHAEQLGHGALEAEMVEHGVPDDGVEGRAPEGQRLHVGGGGADVARRALARVREEPGSHVDAHHGRDGPAGERPSVLARPAADLEHALLRPRHAGGGDQERRPDLLPPAAGRRAIRPVQGAAASEDRLEVRPLGGRVTVHGGWVPRRRTRAPCRVRGRTCG